MRIFNKFHIEIIFLPILNFFVTADANDYTVKDGAETTTGLSYTSAYWNPWEATTNSVVVTTPPRPNDDVNMCTVDAHCHNGGKCGDYCPYIEGLGTGFRNHYSLIYLHCDKLETR